MSVPGIVFRRIGGKIIPIKAAGAAAGVVAKRAASNKSPVPKKSEVKTNPFLIAGSIGVNIAGGLVSGGLLFSGAKLASAGVIGSYGTDALSAGLAGASIAGRGHVKQRAKLLARNVAISEAAGWTAFGATILATKSGREGLKNLATKGLDYASKGIGMAKRFL